ncbi:hypothetical protein KCV06_g577, partial [Aureobasidium melanogenum]
MQDSQFLLDNQGTSADNLLFSIEDDQYVVATCTSSQCARCLHLFEAAAATPDEMRSGEKRESEDMVSGGSRGRVRCGRGVRDVVFGEILGETQQQPSDKLPQKNSLSLNAPNEPQTFGESRNLSYFDSRDSCSSIVAEPSSLGLMISSCFETSFSVADLLGHSNLPSTSPFSSSGLIQDKGSRK